MTRIELKIRGMHCKSCVMLVKEVLTEIKGVKEATIDLEKGKASISYDEKLVKEKQLVDAIEKEGYKVLK
ncbi:MAG: heavy-metal-associated domain-containing protein [Candidatus Woesearchaeota archaeon]